MNRIAVVGAGAWGTALALAAARAGRNVTLLARDAAAVRAFGPRRESPRLPGVALDRSVAVTDDPAAIGDADAVLLAVPAQTLRAVIAGIAPILPAATPLVLCAKGLERDSGALLTEVLAAAAPGRTAAVLSGPTFADEVAAGRPTALTLGAADPALGAALVAAIGSARFRPYWSDDPRGVEIGGALKNVLAIASGIATGLDMGENARAALITRGLVEITRFAVALGGRSETLAGLSGAGDVILSCTSERSRNMALGLALGRGARLDALQARLPGVREGVWTAPAVVRRAAMHAIEMPIAEAVDAILHHGASLQEAIEGLLARPFRRE
ncbi:MAG: NAD(P)H-dependent glycerol-3-phosphate dehydrogenase [Alphaproteobacteria bacterium]